MNHYINTIKDYVEKYVFDIHDDIFANYIADDALNFKKVKFSVIKKLTNSFVDRITNLTFSFVNNKISSEEQNQLKDHCYKIGFVLSFTQKECEFVTTVTIREGFTCIDLCRGYMVDFGVNSIAKFKDGKYVHKFPFEENSMISLSCWKNFWNFIGKRNPFDEAHQILKTKFGVFVNSYYDYNDDFYYLTFCKISDQKEKNQTKKQYISNKINIPLPRSKQNYVENQNLSQPPSYSEFLQQNFYALTPPYFYDYVTQSYYFYDSMKQLWYNENQQNWFNGIGCW